MSSLAASSMQEQSMPPASANRTLILVNPRSFRMSLRGRLPRIETLARDHQVPLREVAGLSEIRQALQDALDQSVQFLVIIGGDGTVQAVISLLAELADQASRPELLVLGGGRTNYTARDIGTQDQLLSTLKLALERPEQLHHTTRHSLIIEHPDIKPAHGFFVAGALVDFIIQDCHRYRERGRSVLRRGHISSAWRVIQLGLLGLLGRVGYRSSHLAIQTEGLGRLEGPVRLLLMTSLHHRRELVDPYADRGDGKIRIMAVTSTARRFWLRLPRLMRGRLKPSMRPESGYLSGRTQEVDILGIESLCLDGQEYHCDPGQTLTVRPGPAFRFMHP
jgi:hypothetical protein